MSEEVQYCWGNADPTKVRGRAPSLPEFPDLTMRFQTSFDGPDEQRDYRVPVLSSNYEGTTFHKDCPKRLLIRQRGSYWWVNSQIKLEDDILRGRLTPVLGAFYVFLEDSCTDGRNELTTFIVRYGNVLQYDTETGYHWIMKTVVFPKDHPDADVPPYQMVDVTH